MEQELHLKDSHYVMKDILPIVNERNGDFALFFNESKTLFAYLFNRNKEKIGEISTKEVPRKYKVLLGYNIDNIGKKYTSFSSNNKRNSFLATSFDFDSKLVVSKEIALPIDEEVFVQALNHNGSFILITITKNSSILNFYSFKDSSAYVKNALELKDFAFLDKKGRKISLYKLLLDKPKLSFSKTSFEDLSFEMIDTSIPVPMEAASHANKLYLFNNKAYFTFDGFDEVAQILSIDLENFEWGKRKIEKPIAKISTDEKKTNSFIFNENVFLISCTKRGLVFRIENLNSGVSVKEHSILVTEEIKINNTPIIQEGGMYDNYREFDRTDKFIRKVFASNVGLAINRYGENYEITVGGTKNISSGAPMMMPMGGIPLATTSLGNLNLTLNYYYYYTSDKSIYFTGLFNSDFDHIDGEIGENSFNKIDNFKENRRDRIFSETVFKYHNDILWGEYLPAKNTYVLRSF
ncbi:hypothetical protein [Flagellimonas marina]|uniref:6-bladed beta-propeller protein n=1 Tax=Flagellimonas marina TaxID=1775168 RepID=A0ABV8PQA4_9FLAO